MGLVMIYCKNTELKWGMNLVQYIIHFITN